jgi:hypothetical protein
MKLRNSLSLHICFRRLGATRRMEASLKSDDYLQTMLSHYGTDIGQYCRAVRDASLQLARLSLDAAVPHRYLMRHLARANANANAPKICALDNLSFSGHFPCFVTSATAQIAAALPFPYPTSVSPCRAEEAGQRRGTGRSPYLFHNRSTFVCS